MAGKQKLEKLKDDNVSYQQISDRATPDKLRQQHQKTPQELQRQHPSSEDASTGCSVTLPEKCARSINKD